MSFPVFSLHHSTQSTGHYTIFCKLMIPFRLMHFMPHFSKLIIRLSFAVCENLRLLLLGHVQYEKRVDSLLNLKFLILSKKVIGLYVRGRHTIAQ